MGTGSSHNAGRGRNARSGRAPPATPTRKREPPGPSGDAPPRPPRAASAVRPGLRLREASGSQRGAHGGGRAPSPARGSAAAPTTPPGTLCAPPAPASGKQALVTRRHCEPDRGHAFDVGPAPLGNKTAGRQPARATGQPARHGHANRGGGGTCGPRCPSWRRAPGLARGPRARTASAGRTESAGEGRPDSAGQCPSPGADVGPASLPPGTQDTG